MKSDKLFYVLVTVFTVLVLVGIIYFSSKFSGNSSFNKAPKKIDTQELIGEDAHVKGDLSSVKVVVVEFADFQCPACKSVQPLVQKVSNDFSKDVAIVYRHFPLISIHKYAFDAAIASEAASIQGKFFEYHDLLYQKQTDNNNPLKKEDYITFAKELGLNTDQFTQDLESATLRTRVQKDLNYARSLGLRGTPTFFVNGEQVDSNNLYKKVKDLVSSSN